MVFEPEGERSERKAPGGGLEGHAGTRSFPLWGIDPRREEKQGRIHRLEHANALPALHQDGGSGGSLLAITMGRSCSVSSAAEEGTGHDHANRTAQHDSGSVTLRRD